ncbi:MAG: alpha/beta fold hydrolase [Pseudomonadota bacterium]
MSAGGDDRFLQHDGARLRWRAQGLRNARGPVLVLIHGWALSLEYWDCVLPGLEPTRAVLRYDRRGFGRTRGPYDPGKACGDLLALLDAAQIDSAVLVGMSQGARVAIHAAIRAAHRVAALVLDGAPWFEDESELPMARYRKLRDSDGIFALRDVILEHPLMQPVHPDAAHRQLLATCVDFYKGDDLEGQWTPVPDPDLKSIRQPTLIINGAQDSDARLAAGRKLGEAIARADRLELHGAGHLAALDNPDEWVHAVLGFTAAKQPWK